MNPAIKSALCRARPPGRRAWLRRLRPWWGHDAHFHVRLACPEGERSCIPQAPVPPGDGCDGTLAWWFTEEATSPASAGAGGRGPLLLSELPAACKRLAVQ